MQMVVFSRIEQNRKRMKHRQKTVSARRLAEFEIRKWVYIVAFLLMFFSTKINSPNVANKLTCHFEFLGMQSIFKNLLKRSLRKNSEFSHSLFRRQWRREQEYHGRQPQCPCHDRPSGIWRSRSRENCWWEVALPLKKFMRNCFFWKKDFSASSSEIRVQVIEWDPYVVLFKVCIVFLVNNIRNYNFWIE